MKYTTLPPIKNVDADMLNKLRSRMPVPISLIVRTALARMAELPEGDYLSAINKQAKTEKQQRNNKKDKQS